MMTVRNQDGRFYFILKEFSFDDFDKSGRISIYKFAKVVEGSRSQLDYQTLQGKGIGSVLLFVRSQRYKIFPGFYSKLKQDRSVKIVSFYSYKGRTSFCVDEETRDMMTDEILAESRYHCVVVSGSTRRPIIMPAQLVKSIQVIQPSDGKRPLPDPKFPGKPSECFSHTRAVMSSDTDSNKHLNQAEYFRYVFDCVSMAAVNGKLSAFRGDIAYSDTKGVWIRYISEASLGEDVMISCWEDEDNPRLIWAELTKGSKLICHCQLEFYEEHLETDQEPVPVSKL